MKSGKEFVSGLFQKKKGLPPAGLPSARLPSAMNSSQGPGGQTNTKGIEIKPNPDRMATRIKRTPLYVAAAVIGVGAYGGYAYLQSHPVFGGNKPQVQSPKVQPATGTGAPTPPRPPKAPHKPAMPGGTAGTPATGVAASAPTSSAAPTSAPPSKNPYATQDAAFEAAMGTGSAGNGSGDGLAWKTPGSQMPQAATLPVATPHTESATGKSRKKAVIPLVKRETSPYEILSGSVIPAVLQTGIKSYLPGEITAVVSQNVYSSVNGATLLIPAGAKLIGTYDTQTALGVNRLAVAWTRIEFPNGTAMNLPGYGGAGGSGYAGFAGEVNDHTWLIFKNALLMSIVEAGMTIASPSTTTSPTGQSTGNTALQDSEESLAQTFGQAESQLLEKYIDIAPTITVHPGYLFSVVVAHDMVFPGPYDSAMQTGSAVTEPALGPKLNPYG